MDATLVMFKADGERREFTLSEKTTLGRKRTCDLRIPVSSVSREHARIEQREDGVYLRDLGSSNGTYVNEDRVQVQKMEAGDTIRIGPMNFTLVLNGEPAEIEPVKSVLPEEAGDSTGVRQKPGGEESGGPGASRRAQPLRDEEDEDSISMANDEEAAPREDRPETPVSTSNGSAGPAESAQRRGGRKDQEKEEEEEDPISALESMAPGEGDEDGEEEEEKDYNDASDTFDAIFGTGDDDDDSISILDEDEDEDKKKEKKKT